MQIYRDNRMLINTFLFDIFLHCGQWYPSCFERTMRNGQQMYNLCIVCMMWSALQEKRIWLLLSQGKAQEKAEKRRCRNTVCTRTKKEAFHMCMKEEGKSWGWKTLTEMDKGQCCFFRRQRKKRKWKGEKSVEREWKRGEMKGQRGTKALQTLYCLIQGSRGWRCLTEFNKAERPLARLCFRQLVNHEVNKIQGSWCPLRWKETPSKEELWSTGPSNKD